MKALIVYSSQSGNTKRLAETIYNNLSCEKQMVPAAEAPIPQNNETLFVGFWLQGGKPDAKTAEYLSKIGKTKVFLFATHGAAKDSDHAQNAMTAAKALAPDAEFIGAFNCQGAVNPKVLETAAKKTPPPPWIKDAPNAAGHPDAKDLAELTAVIQRIG